MATIIQRSVSERSREKCSRTRGTSGHQSSISSGECRHRAQARKVRECRHTESKLRQQARLEYVQSTPNVATIHNSKFASGNPRGGGAGGGSGGGVSHRAGMADNAGLGDKSGNGTGVSGSTANLSKMYSAVSDGELLDLEILPIFQKLLTERHKSGTRGYGANIASCPNISIKCDIVEYL